MNNIPKKCKHDYVLLNIERFDYPDAILEMRRHPFFDGDLIDKYFKAKRGTIAHYKCSTCGHIWIEKTCF